MNRQQRRRAARTDLKVPMVRMADLTMDEAELTAEAYDAYRRLMDIDVPEAERTDLQRWAYARAGQISELLQAQIEGRPAFDLHADRLQPDR